MILGVRFRVVLFECFQIVGLHGEERSHAFVVVERCRASDDRSLKRRDRAADVVDGHTFVAEDDSKLHFVAGNSSNRLNRFFVRVAHLDRIGDRADGLCFQRGGSAVPKLGAADDAVVADRRIASAHLPFDADAELRVPGEAFVGIMTARARDGVVGRESLVEIELPPQFDLRASHQVVGDALHLAGACHQTHRQDDLQRHMVLGLLQPRLNLIAGQRALTGDSRRQFR